MLTPHMSHALDLMEQGYELMLDPLASRAWLRLELFGNYHYEPVRIDTFNGLVDRRLITRDRTEHGREEVWRRTKRGHAMTARAALPGAKI